MKVYLSFEELDANEAVKILAAAGASVIHPNSVTKPKRARRTAAEIKADKEKENTSTEIFDVPANDQASDTADVPDSNSAPDMSPGATNLTEDSIRISLSALNEAKGIEEAKKILKQFNSEQITGVDPKDYVKFIEACEKAAK